MTHQELVVSSVILTKIDDYNLEEAALVFWLSPPSFVINQNRKENLWNHSNKHRQKNNR